MSTIKATTLSNLAASQVVPMDTVVQGSAKAWVNFNGTGTVAINAAFNVSSITDNGVGAYTINFASAMPDAFYALAGFAKADAAETQGSTFRMDDNAAYMVAASCRVAIRGSSTTLADTDVVTAVVFR